MPERRRSKRLDINVRIKLNELKTGFIKADVNKNEMLVDIVNISKDGLAFISSEKLTINTFYDANVVLWTKESFDTVIEIVRIENAEDGKILYGCKFIGILPSDQLKIQIFDMLQDNE